MKNSIKSKKVISIIITIMLLLFTTSVYAANDSFKTALSVSNSSVKKGDNVIVTISLNNISIESGEKGIGAYTAKLGETTIKLTNFSGSNAETDISAEDTAIKITIVDSQNSGSGSGSSSGSSESQSGNQSGSQNGSGTGTNAGSSGNQSTQNGTSSDKTGSSGNQEKLPQTGFYSTSIYILIGAFTLIAIILLTRIKLLNKKVRKH